MASSVHHAAVRSSRRQGVLIACLTRDQRYNALDRGTLRALLRLLQRERTAGGPLVLTGSGPLFSVGPDIAELAALDGEAAASYSRLGHEVVEAIEAWPGPTLAWLQGYCLGSALELALACDVLTGTEDLRLGLPGLAWAMVPCMGGLRRLSMRVGSESATRLFLSGDVINGRQARAQGLLNRLVPDPGDAERLALEIDELGLSAVLAMRQMRLHQLGPQDHEAEVALFAQPFATGECQRRLRQLLA